MKLELQPVTVASPRALNAVQSWPERRSLLLRLSDHQGGSGSGECSPLPGYSPDSLDEAEAALRNLPASALTKALEQDSPRAALSAIGALVPDSLPSARMALETAALDLLGQRHSLSAPSLLGASPDATRPLAQLIGLASSPHAVEDAARAVADGFVHLKLKLGAPGQLPAELVGLQALRAQMGPQVKLRVDSNGAHTGVAIEAAWQAIAPLDLELWEEPGPLPQSLLGVLPLALDESLQGLSLEESQALLRHTRARALVLKPMAVGGIVRCLALAEMALAVGASVVISHLFDGPWAWRASAALALCLPPTAAHGLAPHAGLDGWGALWLPVQRGTLLTWADAGLGLSLRPVGA